MAPPKRRRPPRPGALSDLSPLRILTQIAILQIAYYAVAVVLTVFAALSAGKHMQIGLVLDWHTLRGDVTEGWMYGLCWMLDAGVMVIFLLLLIARSKLVPDFALTIHGLHLLATSLYTRSIPTYIFWWLVQAASAGLMVFVGMWACQWRELRPIAFGGNGGGNNNNVNGAGRDGRGEYEMVTVKETV